MSQIEWIPVPDEIAKRARRNWYALCFHRAETAKTLNDPLILLDKIEVCVRDGVIHGVRFQEESANRVFLEPEHSAGLLEQQANALRQYFQSGKRIIVISGLCSGRLLNSLNALLNEYSSTAVCIFEPRLESWCAAMLDLQYAEVLSHPRLFLFGGSNAYSQSIDLIRKEYLFLLPHAEFAYMLGVMPADENALQYVQFAKDAATAIQEKNLQFDGPLTQFLQHTQKQLSGQPHSIWACTHRESYIHFPLLKAFLRGFPQAGLSTRLSEYDNQFTTSFRIMGELIKAKPDCIFSINAWPDALLEDFGLSQSAVKAMQVPRICWLVDDTKLYEDEAKDSPFQPNDWIIASDRTYLTWLNKLTQQAFFMPPATMFEKKGSIKSEYEVPISYVGSLPNIISELNKASDITKEILKKIDSLKQSQSSSTYVNLLNQLSPSAQSREQITSLSQQFTSQTRKAFQTDQAMVEYFLFNVATFYKRLHIVEALIPRGLYVYGPESWREVLSTQYQHRYRGFVENKDLANVYASSRMSLNIHSHQCPTCLNTRDFDVPMAGGAVLGDWVEDVERGILEPNKETLTFHSTEEAQELAKSYLSHFDALQQIRQDGYNRIIAEHTYKHRAQAVLSRITQ